MFKMCEKKIQNSSSFTAQNKAVRGVNSSLTAQVRKLQLSERAHDLFAGILLNNVPIYPVIFSEQFRRINIQLFVSKQYCMSSLQWGVLGQNRVLEKLILFIMYGLRSHLCSNSFQRTIVIRQCLVDGRLPFYGHYLTTNHKVIKRVIKFLVQI